MRMLRTKRTELLAPGHTSSEWRIFFFQSRLFHHFAAVCLFLLLGIPEEPFMFRPILEKIELLWLLWCDPHLLWCDPCLPWAFFSYSFHAYEHRLTTWIGSGLALIFFVWFDASDFLWSILLASSYRMTWEGMWRLFTPQTKMRW